MYVICKPCHHGAEDNGDIAGLKCHVLISASSVQCRGTAVLLIPCPNQANFRFTWRDLSRAFCRALTSSGHIPGLCREKSIFLLFFGSVGAVVFVPFMI